MKERTTMSLLIGNKFGNRSDYATVSLGMYPDNTPVVDLEEAWNRFAGQDTTFMISRPDSLHEFVTHMFVADSFYERGGRIDSLILPRIPGARQDRVKWEGDWLFTLKSIAKMINDRHFDKVITLDPHSLATTALIDRLVVPEIRLRHCMEDAGINTNLYAGIIAPDLGASKRAQEAADMFELPVFQAGKVRDPQTNKLSGFHFYSTLIPSNRYLVVDDLCDAGGTFIGLAEEAKKVYGVTLDLFVTHGLFTKGTSALEKVYNNIITTDSVEINNPPVMTLKVTEGLTLYV
jgi:ribose-phosphate pyrophosphokinase